MKNTQWDENENDEIYLFGMNDSHLGLNKNTTSSEEVHLSNAEITELRRRVEDRLESRRLRFLESGDDHRDSYWEDSSLDQLS
jgi:hypothetical protein